MNMKGKNIDNETNVFKKSPRDKYLETNAAF